MNEPIKEPTIEEVEKKYNIPIDDYPRFIEIFYKQEPYFLVRRVRIRIPTHELQKIFNLSSQNSMILLGYDISSKEALELQKYFTEEINLNKFDYQITAYPPE